MSAVHDAEKMATIDKISYICSGWGNFRGVKRAYCCTAQRRSWWWTDL